MVSISGVIKVKKCEIGDVFGKLVITKTWSQSFTDASRKQKVCECRCDCGIVLVVRASALRHDGKKSCGCNDDGRGSRNLCKVGEKYGQLTILKNWSQKFENRKSKERVCECKCDCGEIVIVRGTYIRNGHKRSCGCLQKLNNHNHHAWKGHGEISMSEWNGIKGSSKRRKRHIPFCLTIEEAWDLFLKQERKCSLSGVEISFSERNKKYGAETNTASLDRIDSSKGYTIDNVQWVHKVVNIMKMSLSQDEFIQWCHTIAANKEQAKI